MQTQARLETFYGMPANALAPWAVCGRCEYPTPVADQADGKCPECRAGAAAGR